MSLHTPLCDLLGIEHPVVQAPIGTAACPGLAAAVSNAGGLGTLALSWTPLDRIASVVAETRSLTERPFGVNLVLPWDQRERLERALEAGAPVVSLAWGEPAPYAEAAHAAGATVIAAAASAEEARRAVAAGADAVVAQGWEAGGHVLGTVSTLALVPPVVDAVAPVPVIAAGGIGDGRGLAAVLVLGAAGAMLGTRFLLAEETPIHPEYRDRLLAACETDTVYSTLFDVGWPDAPHRTLRNSTVEAWEAAGRPPSGSRPGEGEPIALRADGGPIVRYSAALPLTGAGGEIEALSLWAGQSVALANSVRPAGEIVREIVAAAVAALERLR